MRGCINGGGGVPFLSACLHLCSVLVCMQNCMHAAGVHVYICLSHVSVFLRDPLTRLGVSCIDAIEALQQLVLAVPSLLSFISATQWNSLLDLFFKKRSHHIFAAKFLSILKRVLLFLLPLLFVLLLLLLVLLSMFCCFLYCFFKRTWMHACTRLLLLVACM